MMFPIRLYSTDPDAASPTSIVEVVPAVDFSSAVEVSRTVGPANWYAIEKRSLDGGTVCSPPEDISRARHTNPSKIAELARADSVLTVSYAFTRSNRLGAVSDAICNEVPREAQGFYWSSAKFAFGPSDIYEFTEDDDGQDDVRLLAVAYFVFVISCDNYAGQVDRLVSSLDTVSEFVRLRNDLQRIVGPLHLQVS